MTQTATDTMELTSIAMSPADQANFEQIEAVIRDSELALGDAGGKVQKAFVMAKGISTLRQKITDKMMVEVVMPLMNTRLGFKTDKDPNRATKNKQTGEWENPKPYPIPVVKDCIIEGLLRGAQIVGNEINIISAQAYFTKEFFERRLGELPGVTNIVPSPGVPRNENGKTLIRFGLSWKVNGQSDCLKDAEGKAGRVFEIKSDQYSSADQVIGKATRKAYAAAYRQITGSTLAPDGDATEMVEGEAVTPSNGAKRGAENLTEKLRTNAKSSPQPPAEGSADQTQGTVPGSAAEGDTAQDDSGEVVDADTGEVAGEGTAKKAAAVQPLPNPCSHEQIVNLVALAANLDLAAAEKTMKPTMAKKWHELSREGQEAWWKRFNGGEIKTLKPVG